MKVFMKSKKKKKEVNSHNLILLVCKIQNSYTCSNIKVHMPSLNSSCFNPLINISKNGSCGGPLTLNPD